MLALRRTTLSLAAAFGLAALAAGAVLADPPASSAAPAAAAPAAPSPAAGRQRHGGGNPLAAALKAAGLTAEQKAKVKDLTTKHADDLKAVTDRTSPAGRAQVKTLNDKYQADIKALLTPEQLARFDSAMAWESPLGRPLTTLNLTDDEKTKISPILKDASGQWTAAASLRGAERRTRDEAIIADFKAKVRPLLTADQQPLLDSLNFAPARGGRRLAAPAAAAPAAPAAATGAAAGS